MHSDACHVRCGRRLLPAAMAFAAVMMLAGMPVRAAEGASDYRLGPGDTLHITVFDHDELGADPRVNDSGNITFPLVGELAVASLTTREAETLLAERLEGGRFLRQPQVSVTVTDFQSQKVSVMGQVQKPGQYALTQSQKVLDMLGQAGGVQVDATADEARLISKDGATSSIDLRRLFAGDPAANLTVHNGDTLLVPQSPRFFIYGEVQHPGVYRLERDMTFLQAIAAGGGLTGKGTIRSMAVKRKDRYGVERTLSLKSALRLQPADVVIVKERLF